jgi:hypothetical protein
MAAVLKFLAAVSTVISQGGADPRVGCATQSHPYALSDLLRSAPAVYRYVPSYGRGTVPWDYQWDWGYVAPRYYLPRHYGPHPDAAIAVNRQGSPTCRNKGHSEQLST